MTTKPGETNFNGNHRSDDELLAILAAGHAESDPPPDSLRDVALRALTWDTGFAQLITATPVEDPVLVRGGEGVAATADPEVLDVVFEVEGRLLEVAIEPGGVPGTHLVSGLVHPRCDEILLVKPGVDPRPVECDSFGRFEVDGVTGPVALAFELDDGRLIRTELLDLP